ncbi:DNA-binding domain-containing protein [Nostoc sp.]|uniref:DNA-binding domain-containing protein n=1 Tax=Nostoc sp. TaxID=1180 RepID=UPI002FF9988F
MSKPQIAIRILPSLLKELNSYVERTSTSRTDVVVGAIATYLGCGSKIPLSQQVAELEAKVEELQILVKK